jgi:hypothetical protein
LVLGEDRFFADGRLKLEERESRVGHQTENDHKRAATHTILRNFHSIGDRLRAEIERLGFQILASTARFFSQNEIPALRIIGHESLSNGRRRLWPSYQYHSAI